MTEFIRVTDGVKPRREYTIPESAFDEVGGHKRLNKPSTSADGTPLPPKYTPESLGADDAPPTEFPPYADRTVKQLEGEIDTRNAARDESGRISKDGNKSDLVSALEADDESLSNSGHSATTNEEIDR